MKNLKNRSLPLCLMILIGCQSNKVFDIQSFEKDELHIVKIQTERIKHDCYFVNAEKENKWRHQYFLYMLTDNNKVISAMFPTNQGKPECMEHLKKVEKIFKNNKEVKFCLRGEIESKPNGEGDIQDFKHLGKYKAENYALTFDTICNSKECYSISDTWTDTCPDMNIK